jgi:ATP-dependent exoDNAse (exonuclease V) beta subunit
LGTTANNHKGTGAITAAEGSAENTMSVVVEASAGTGKTRWLVRRVADVIEAGAAMEGIAAVTFTKAAAGELKLRLRGELLSRDLKAAVQQLERPFVGTIHAFCANLLRLHPVEASVDPSFRELSEPEAQRLFGSVFRPWLDQRISTGSPVLRRVLTRVDEWDGDRDPAGALLRAAWDLIEWRDFGAEWRRPADFNREASVQGLFGQVAALSESHRQCRVIPDSTHEALEQLAASAQRYRRACKLGRVDFDSLEAELLGLLRIKGLRYPKRASGREEVLEAWGELKAALERFRDLANADLAAELRGELWPTLRLYEQAKRQSGALDFMDLLLGARRLLRGDGVRAILRERYTHLFVDEFQDTDPLQAEILVRLASDVDDSPTDWMQLRPRPGKLYVVGDPKQSIYRFRRADVQLYGALRERLLQHGASTEQLASNTRSVSPIHEFVNAAFESAFQPYVALRDGRSAIENQPAIIALPVPKCYKGPYVSTEAIESCAPDTTAAFVKWLLGKSGWRVTERDGMMRAVREEDICILFRRFMSWNEDISREYALALEARGIAHTLAASRSFHRREEIGAVRTALRAIESPDDELSVYATVRTFFGVLDTTLFRFREQHGPLHPFRIPEGDDLDYASILQALQLLARLHSERNRRPLAATMHDFLQSTRAHAAFALRHSGELVLANVQRLLDLARDYEVNAATSFRSFVEYLEGEADGGDSREAPVLERHSGGVQLMTAYTAKGLEFPVVILADPTAKLHRAGGSDRHVDPERQLCAQRLLGWVPFELLEKLDEEDAASRAEGFRVAYVAATRARDLLVVSAVGAPEYLKHANYENGWLSPLYPALYPPQNRWRAGVAATGVTPRGDATILFRPDDWFGDEDSVRPGTHSPQRGTHTVEWFDPKLLEIQRPQLTGVGHEDLLADTEARSAGLQKYQQWTVNRQAAIDAGSSRMFTVVRATEPGDLEEARHIDVDVVRIAEGKHRSGRAFGKVVHALLADRDPERGARGYARQHGLPEAEVPIAIETARTALSHPVLAAAAQSQRCYRELPVSARLADGTIVEGRIDLAYYDGETWTVVDYKTGPRRSGSEQQLRRYAWALERATGGPVRAIVLEI